MSEETIYKIVLFVFKLAFYWPFRILFLLCRWIFEMVQEASWKRRNIKLDEQFAREKREIEQERRSRNTLYAGPQQPDT